MHKSVIALTVVAFATAGSAACATKGFVRTQVSQVSEKVDTLGQSLEETQKRTQANESRIGEVDQRAGAAGSAADKAGTAAAAADQRAAAAGTSAQAAQMSVFLPVNAGTVSTLPLDTFITRRPT